MQANVICPTTTGAGGSGPLLTVQFVGPANSGSVDIEPVALACSATCAVNVSSGSAVNISATANTGFTFGGWNGCDSTSGQICIINGLTADRTVTVTFN